MKHVIRLLAVVSLGLKFMSHVHMLLGHDLVSIILVVENVLPNYPDYMNTPFIDKVYLSI